MKFFFSLLLLYLTCSTVSAQDIFGRWKTIDDETEKVKAIVNIYEKDHKAYGSIEEIFRGPTENPDPYCTPCKDDRKDQRVIGMEIIRGLEQDENEWEDGTILDPENGKVYDCKLWVDEEDANLLNVRGYIAIFYRTQTWVRVED